MRNIPALTWREINATFFSPLAYVVLTLYLFFSGFFFYLILEASNQASMSGLIGILTFLFLISIPLLTMRLMSDEYRSGTIETLMTAPITDAEVILGKYLGAVLFFLFMLAPTLLYIVILKRFGNPDMGPIFSAYLGLILMGAMFIALGLFCSTLTRNQIVAGVLGIVTLLIIWVLGAVGDRMNGDLAPIVRYIGTQQHVQSFSSGRIAFRDCFYFLSFTAFWLFLSVRVLESKRWR